MKVLVTGASGQVGLALARDPAPGVQVSALDRAALDITDPAAIARALDSLRPHVLINTAAYTAVDQAESEQQQAHAANAGAVGHLARECAARGVRLVHISTDFVFDGTQGRPYGPTDAPNPLGVYGASKLAGERLIQGQARLDWRIVRTAWVYASTGRNFMLTMLRLMREKPIVRVVADQIGTPTSATSLAHCIWRAALDEGQPAILHFTDAGACSWYDFAVSIQEEALALSLLTNSAQVVPIGTDQYPTRARRPSYSVLEKRSTFERLALTPVHWRVRLRETLQGLKS